MHVLMDKHTGLCRWLLGYVKISELSLGKDRPVISLPAVSNLSRQHRRPIEIEQEKFLSLLRRVISEDSG